ncbi:MAG: type II CAAX endopeptidase family protein [Thermosynechococcus sp. Uc]|uniref:CPBP family intramembrane glutamic endopeptidase n=1 Tax=Thermosynechococcus sp. Uc TaxID=3034853 RepID=UPI00259DED6B|nr:type II CAAX endopeptidase family protein [Thermosynechococcus sp. Uc]MDM7327132.1 type II CAAX endopeptidase family protein [Thermosynechococcus sp. Uc]
MIRRPFWIRILSFALTLLLLWLPWGLSIYFFWGEGGAARFVNMGLLYLIFIFLLRVWGRRVHQQRSPLGFYGLRGGWIFGRDALGGWFAGVFLVALLFLIEGLLGWVMWQGLPDRFGLLLLNGVLTGVAVGFAEELLFRGWLLQELELEYQPWFALLLNGLIFAALHYLHPLEVILATWPQFFGLALLGWILGLGKWVFGGRLGFPMGLHGGLVWAYFGVNVGKLVSYTGVAPEWLTGVNGNPIAGLMGVCILILVALGLSYRVATAP